MSILGVIVRVHPRDREAVKQRLAHTPGVDLGPDAGDGRLIAVIESTADTPAASIMADVAGWFEVLNLSLVFEHSGGDAAPADAAGFDFRAWRGHVGDFARRQAESTSIFMSPPSTSATPGAGEAR
jgi:nitrate reductase NapAB chaperone NapD